MKTLIALLGLVLTLQTSSALASDYVKKTVEVDGFSRVALSGAAELIVHQGDDQKLVITASKKMMERIQVKQKGDRLQLKIKNSMWGFFDFDSHVRFAVTMPVIDAISAAGSGKVQAGDIQSKHLKLGRSGSGEMHFGKITAQRLSLEMAGSGDFNAIEVTVETLDLESAGSGDMAIDVINMEDMEVEIAGSGDLAVGLLNGEKLEVELAGSSDVTIRDGGKVLEQDIDIAGSSDYNAGKLESQHARLDLSGSVDAHVFVTDTLEVDASGAADVRYHGHPEVSASTSGASGVEALDTHANRTDDH